MAVQYSIQKMVSDGTLSTIALGIQYLQRNDIYIRIDGEETPQSGAPSGYTWSFINNTTLKILPVVPNGVEVVVYRRTDVDAMYNIYSQNAQFDEATIDENNQQLLYIAQEYLEQGIPGAGVASLEYVSTVAGVNYYRFKLTDGSYTPVFGVPDGTVALRTELAASGGVALLGYAGGMTLADLIATEPSVITPYITVAPTHKEGFQNAINAGSIRIPAGSNITISGDITIPANRLIIVDFGATITSNGRFTAYGVNNVHWRVGGKLLSVGMTDAPAKSGWPNTGEGTQNGNERAFIEFGGVIFGGNDGVDYSFHLSNTGVLAGDWVGTPNASDIPRIVNRKGVAAWNCSNVDFVLDGEVYGFEGETVYWFSRSADAKNVYMRAKNLHDCRFNGVNVNARNAFENIKIEASNTKNTYQGIESSAGDVIDCTDHGSFKAIYAGQGAGGKSRKISGNKSYDCKGTPFSIVYNRNFEGSGRVRNVTVTDNHAFDPADGFIAAGDIDGIQMHSNTCTRLKAGRFLQVTGCIDGAVTGNLNVSPAAGTAHIYRADNTAVAFSGNDKSFPGNDYTAVDTKSNGFIGGKSSSIMTHGNRENFQDLYCQPDLTGVGGEYRYSYGDAIGFIGATTCTALTQFDGSGATAEWRVNNLKYNTGDVLGTSLRITHQGHVLPGTNGTQNVGSAVLPWNQVFAAVGTIQPSDRRIKEQIEDIPDLALDAYGSIAHKRFKYKAAVGEKGEDARWHTGLIAQDIKEAFAAVGLDATEYGLLCYNSWPDIYEPVFEEVEEDGKLVMKDTGNTRLVMAAGDRWSIRPDECNFMEAAYQRRELKRLSGLVNSLR